MRLDDPAPEPKRPIVCVESMLAADCRLCTPDSNGWVTVAYDQSGWVWSVGPGRWADAREIAPF